MSQLVENTIANPFDTLPIAVLTADAQGKIETWNQALTKMTGRSADEVVGKRAWNGFFDARNRTPIEEVLLSEESVEREFDFEHALSGDVETVMFSAQPVFENDEVVGVTAVLTQGVAREKNDQTLGQLEAINRSLAVIEFEMDGTIVTANENFLQTMGYTLNEVQGKHHSMFADEVYARSNEYKAFWASLNRGEYQSAEYKRFGKQGKEVWIQASYNPIFNESGKPVKVVKYATDITDQKLKNADYEGQIEAIKKSQAVIEFEMDGTIVMANENFLQTMGYTLDEIQGKHHSMFADEVYARSNEYKAFWASLNRGEYQSAEYKRFGKQGKEVWIQASYNPICDETGKPIKVVKYATDITDQKLKNADYEGQIEAIKKSQAVIEFEMDGTIVTANENFLQTMGYTLDEIRGKHHRIFAEETYAKSDEYKVFWEALNRGEFQAGDFLRFSKDGEEVWISASYNPILDADGKPFKVVKYATDITAQKKAASMASAVENSTASFMLCDRDFRITYLNPSAFEMLGTYQDDLRKVFSGFDVNKLVGTCIDDFHKNPHHQRGLLNDVSRMPYSTELNLAGLEFGLTAIALMDTDGNHIGNAIEWTDYNDRAVYKKEVNRVYDAIQNGELDARGDLEVLSEAYQPMMQNINDIVDAIVDPLKVTADYVNRISNGDIPDEIEASYAGEFEEIKNNLNRCIVTLRNLIVDDGGVALQAAADKDMTQRVTGEYEGLFETMKDNINGVLENLDSALSQVAATTDQVASASGQISAGSQTLAQGASEQASSLEQISSSLQEVASMAKQSASNAQEAKGLAEGAKSGTEKGVNSMNRLSEAMSKIKASSDETAKIVKTIDEIAFQTNLLALNAAVEAARAGDAGKGFAVVAEEVRNLAQRSAEAAKTTANLIDESVQNAENGVSLNEEVLSNLSGINDQVNKMSAMMEEIATGAIQQDEALEQVNTGVEQVNQVTQQNAANAEESASASEELSSQAAEMRSLVSLFTLSDQDGNYLHAREEAMSELLESPKPKNGTVKGYKNGVKNGFKNGVSKNPKLLIPLEDEDSDILEQF